MPTFRSLVISLRRLQLLFVLMISFMPISLYAQAPVDDSAISPDVALQPDLDNGSTIYDNACGDCHGETGQGGQGAGPALSDTLSLSEIMLVVNDGRNTMPAFDVFTDQELVDISTFVAERLHQ